MKTLQCTATSFFLYAMAKSTIRLIYRKVINAASQDAWDQLVFEDTYREFLMQAQAFNADKKYATFGELISYVPGAERLHFLVSPSVIGYLRQLNGIVPNIINNIGKRFLPFKNYRFEIINSDLNDKAKHQIGINFISEPLVWHTTIGDQLLVSVNDGQTDEHGETLTELFAIPPYLSIYSLKLSADDTAI